MSNFQIRPFAYMRLTHEALRAGIRELQAAASEGSVEQTRAVYEALSRTIAVHAAQEEAVFFPLLDGMFDDAVKNAGLHDAHEREEAHQQAVEAALAGGDAEAIAQAVEAWAPSFEKHLADEEAVMMPLTVKTADTFEGRVAHVRRILESEWSAVTDHQIDYVVSKLASTKPYGPVRMFVASVQAAAGERYAELEPIVAAAVTPEVRNQLTFHGHLSASA